MSKIARVLIFALIACCIMVVAIAEDSSRGVLEGCRSLAIADPEMSDLIAEERRRQIEGIELIASENFTSRAVMECLGSCLTNKYSEGQPGGRYYGGNEVIDKIENLCKERALKAFGLAKNEWGVNVQPYSGSPANFAVYTALLNPHDRIMGLDLPSGGHLTHGFYTAKKRVSATSIFFESLPYSVDPVSGLIDFVQLRERALLFRPKLIIAGGSAYPREIDWLKFRNICDEVGAIFMVDMAHISGLVAGGAHSSPFKFADIVTTTTHKSLRGPRSGVIFYRSGLEKFPDMKERIDGAVFPALQGGPHNHQIAALATQLLEVNTPAFSQYAHEVVQNARALANALIDLGHKLATDGTDNHLLLWDLRPHGISGSKFEKVCDAVGVTLNKNTVNGDISALNPGGVRIGSPAMTTRGCKESDFVEIAKILDSALDLAKQVQKESGAQKLADFQVFLKNEKFAQEINQIKQCVKSFAIRFGYPGI